MEEMELDLVACDDAVILELTTLGTGQAFHYSSIIPFLRAKAIMVLGIM